MNRVGLLTNWTALALILELENAARGSLANGNDFSMISPPFPGFKIGFRAFSLIKKNFIELLSDLSKASPIFFFELRVLGSSSFDFSELCFMLSRCPKEPYEFWEFE